VRGVLETLDDPYTVLVEPVSRQFEQDDLRGSYGGVGLALNRGPEGQVLLSPMRDSPAAQAGVQEADILLAVDELKITPGLDISRDIAAKIRGEVGTDVILTIQRGDETLVFTITRHVIETPSVTWRMLDEAPTLGYVQIESFTDRTVDELRAALQELIAAGASALILDLRDNGGGLLQSAIDVADQFLDEGVVLYENRRGEAEKSYIAREDGEALDIPLAVLVNQGTASASEIVAGALQDRDRGPLIGESTFGKGSVQLIFDLSDGSSLHVTAARWYTPNRHQLDAVGLTPDFVVESSTDANTYTDPQLERAITFLLTGR
jgi:carboxyl-terminal processing protease